MPRLPWLTWLKILDILINDITGLGAMMWQERPGQEIDLGENVKRAAEQVKAAMAAP